MKIPLGYQRTEYDCGPTSMLNGLSFLFGREALPPDVLKYVSLYCMDSYNGRGEQGKRGTSNMAMMFVSHWLNEFGRAKGFAVEAEYLSGTAVHAGRGGRLDAALQSGGVVLARVRYGCWHYVLLTGRQGECYRLFDPYFRRRAFTQPGIELVEGSPETHNRLVAAELLETAGRHPYSLGAQEEREAVLLFNKQTRVEIEESVEYYI